MNIYVCHSTSFDFSNELYKPIREMAVNKNHRIVLPHENSDEQFNSKDFFETDCDSIIAEVSYPSTGMGIELGWASYLKLPIVAIHKQDSKVSGAIKVITNEIFSYNDETLEEVLSKAINDHNE